MHGLTLAEFVSSPVAPPCAIRVQVAAETFWAWGHLQGGAHAALTRGPHHDTATR